MPKSRLKPSAAPRNSARSVAIATTSISDPHRPDDRPREALAADARPGSARGDAELGGERLDEHRHQVAGDDHPQQRVAELRAALDVGGEVAGVHVGDAGDEGRPEERQQPGEHAALFPAREDLPAQPPVRETAGRSGDVVGVLIGESLLSRRAAAWTSTWNTSAVRRRLTVRSG